MGERKELPVLLLHQSLCVELINCRKTFYCSDYQRSGLVLEGSLILSGVEEEKRDEVKSLMFKSDLLWMVNFATSFLSDLGLLSPTNPWFSCPGNGSCGIFLQLLLV